MYDKDLNLARFVEGKSIAIVGPSAHLQGRGIGKKIDEFDLIVRLEDFFPWGFENDYGSRSDICSTCCGTIDLDPADKKLEELCTLYKKPSYLICPVVKALGPDAWQFWSDDYVSPVVENLKKINRYDIPYYWIGVKNYREFYKLIGSEPNSGMVTISLLLQYDIKEMFITGISFYAQGNTAYQAYRMGYSYRPGNYATGDMSHKQAPQINYFKNVLMKNHGHKIIVDSFLNSLLSLNHNKVIDV